MTTKKPYSFVPYIDYVAVEPTESVERSAAYYQQMRRRRTVREFSSRPVPREIIDNCLLTAGTAVSGANLQPWHFAVVSNPEIKHKIRLAAEKEEREFYRSKAPQQWLDALAPLGTDEHKPFLEKAPCLIAIFQQRYSHNSAGEKLKHYYASESVGIATGLLISAVHNAGLVSLTHTPNPMGFLNEILDRPKSERPFLLLVVGYPMEDVLVPDIDKKSLEDIATFLE